MTSAKILYGSVLTVFCMMAVSAMAATTAAASTNQRALEQVVDRDDRDTGHTLQAIAVCGSGFPTRELPDMAIACHIAHLHTLQGGDYDLAMRYAMLGCEKYRSIGSCRQVAQLPILLGQQGVVVPESFQRDLRHIARQVCFSGMRLKIPNGADVTARECAYLARQFNLTRDPEYMVAFDVAKMRFHQNIQDQAFAGQLYAAACERLGGADNCDTARALGAVVRRAAVDSTVTKKQQQR